MEKQSEIKSLGEKLEELRRESDGLRVQYEKEIGERDGVIREREGQLEEKTNELEEKLNELKEKQMMV